MKLLLWCLLLVVCWPLALALLVAWPLLWLLTLPLRLVWAGVQILLGLLFLPVRRFGPTRRRLPTNPRCNPRRA